MITAVGFENTINKDLDINYSFTPPRKVYEHFKENYKKYIEKNLTIGSCHSDIFNIIGHMINKGLIKNNEVKGILIFEDGIEKEFSYTEDGYVDENYYFGFFNWMTDFE